MKITNLSFSANTENRRQLINSKNTGYLATSGVALALVSGITKNKSFKKSHKYIALATSALIALHIFCIANYRRLYRANEHKQ